MVMARIESMSAADHARVSAAVHDAETGTAGEIVTIVADTSDLYLDIALWWAIAAAVLALGALTAFPDLYFGLASRFSNGWIIEWSRSEVLEMALALVILTFGLTRLILQWMPLRLFLTPKMTKARRVRRRAIRYFKVGAESRTTGKTGILIYLSMAERMAEIVADEAIHTAVAPEAWGEAMAHLVAEVRLGRVADGMIASIRDVGDILSQHLPRATDDVNELPDRLIEL
jgi:putative membrane protein